MAETSSSSCTERGDSNREGFLYWNGEKLYGVK
jgi:hypothetical protein